VNDRELIDAIRVVAQGGATVTGAMRPLAGRGTWFTLSSGHAICIERTPAGWDLSDVTSCLA